jgi:hypothetical protein
VPRIPETKAEIEALGWEELKALALAYPEAECLPEERRKPWLSERWVGRTQADHDLPRSARRGRCASDRVHGRLATPRRTSHAIWNRSDTRSRRVYPSAVRRDPRLDVSAVAGQAGTDPVATTVRMGPGAAVPSRAVVETGLRQWGRA